jgi:hypothetical protein
MWQRFEFELLRELESANTLFLGRSLTAGPCMQRFLSSLVVRPAQLLASSVASGTSLVFKTTLRDVSAAFPLGG